MAGTEVGKVALGIEFVGDISKQIAEMARDMGQRLAESFGAALQGVDFGNAMKGTIIPHISAAAVAPPSVPAASVVTPSKSRTKQKFDADAAKTEIESLTALLDNINAKIELQQRKLAQLKESYENTFNEEKKLKLQEKIINTEAAILRLTNASDKTAAKIWALDDALQKYQKEQQSAAAAAQQTAAANQKVANASQQASSAKIRAANSANQVARSTQNANKVLNQSGKQFKAAAKGATRAGSAFAAAGKRATNMGNQFTAAFKRIAKQVLVFAVMYKAIRGFRDYMGSSLRTNEQYAKSLSAIRTNMLTAFQPIYQAILPAINALMAGLAKVTAYIAAFISALFGKTYKQSYEAAKGLQDARKAMDGYGKSAKKAAASLAAFDELNVLDTKDEDSGGKSDIWEMEMPELDIDRIQTEMDALALSVRTAFERAFGAIREGWNWTVSTFGPGIQRAWGIIQPELARWKEVFGATFQDILSLGEPLKNWWQTGVLPLWEQSVAGVATILAGLSESVRNAFVSIWQAAFPIIEKFVSDGLPRITEFATEVQNIFLGMFDLIKSVFDDIWQDVVDPVLRIISQMIRDTLDIVFDWWDSWGKKIVANISDTLGRIKELWNNLWEKMLKPIVTRMLDTLTKLWNDHLKDLLIEIGNFVGKLVTAAQDILNKFILPIVNWLVQKLGPIFTEIFDGVITVVGNALGAIIDAAKGIIKALGGIIDFIAGVFTGDWKRAWEGIKTFFGGIWDGVVALFKGAINIIIDTMNWLIKQINKISIDIPDWVPGGLGGKTLGFNIPTIPRLAEGGLVTGPTLAWVGDNRNAAVDPEVVTPLSKLQEMLSGSNQEVVEALYMIAQLLQDYVRRPVILEANGTQLAKVVDGARDDRMRRAGRTLALT